MVRRFNLGVFYDLWPPFWPIYNQKMKKRKVDSSANFLRRIQICFQKRKIPILKFWPPIGGPLVTPWPLTSVVESSPTLFWPSKSVRWKVRTLSLMYFLCMSQFQKKRLKLGPYLKTFQKWTHSFSWFVDGLNGINKLFVLLEFRYVIPRSIHG